MSKMFGGRGLDGGTGTGLTQKYEHLRDKSEDELLDAFVDDIFSAPDTEIDLERFDAYLDALDEKDPLPFEIDEEKMFAAFKEKHALLFEDAGETSRPAHRNHGLPRKIAAVVLAAVLCGSVCVQASGFDIFGAITRWTQDIFSFQLAGSEREHAPAVLSAEYTSIQEAVDALAIKEKVVPTRYPEGYELDHVKTTIMKDWAKIRATFKNGDKEFCFTIRHFDTAENATKADTEKDGKDVELYTVNDISHYILNNVETPTVTWINNTTVCMINGDLSEEDIKTMIDSIYER